MVREITPGDEADFADRIEEFTFLPDGYAVVQEFNVAGDDVLNILWMVEVEDTHAMPEWKLHDYIDLWTHADDTEYWDVRLFVTDRYGRGDQLDLCGLASARVIARHDEAHRRAKKSDPKRYREAGWKQVSKSGKWPVWKMKSNGATYRVRQIRDTFYATEIEGGQRTPLGQTNSFEAAKSLCSARQQARAEP